MAKNLIRKSNSVNQGRSFTSFQMFHTFTRTSARADTHAHTQFRHTHTHLFHTQLCHTQLFRTQLCHTHNFVTYIFVTHRHNSFAHNFVADNPFTYKSLKLSILHHILCPSCLLRTASATVSDYWTPLTCRVSRSFNLLILWDSLTFPYLVEIPVKSSNKSL